MTENNISIAEAFYAAMGGKNIARMEQYVHPNIQFRGPLAEVTGKEEYLEVVKNFMDFFKTLTVRAKFGSEDQAMLVYDVEFPAPIGNCPSAALMTFKENLIIKVELFYDARPFEKLKDEIFS